MINKRRLLVALLTVPAIVLAGCATTVAGDAKPATTFSNPPTTSSSVESTTSSSEDSTTSSSEIPPVPPSSDTTESSDTSTESSDTSSDTGTTDSTETTNTTNASETIGGVSIPDVLSDLGDDNVALVNSSVDADALAAEVSSARTAGLELSVVSIGDKISDSDAGAVADALFKTVKGTVLVLTPTLVTSRSDQLTSAQLKAANKAASSGSDDVAAAQKYVASALGADAPTSSKVAPTTTKKTTSAAPTTDMVNGVDVKALASATTNDGVAIASGVTGVDRAALVSLVKQAKTKGLDLTIFILKDDVKGHLYDVADGVKKYSKDTVIGMSPTVYAISSDAYTNAELQAAIDAASNATTYEEVATEMTSSLESN